MLTEVWSNKQPDNEMLHDRLLTNTLCLDYLTLTSYDTMLLEAHARYLMSRIPDHMPISKKRMQYDGVFCDGVFFGIGKQHIGYHSILQVPGWRSWAMAQIAQLEPEGVRCSRFDLQVTVPLDEVVEPSFLYELLTHPVVQQWHQTGPAPKLQLIQNSDGYDTLYIGSRTSELFRRIYVKNIEGERWLRFEVEVKANLARALWARGDVASREGQAAFFAHQFHALPDDIQSVLEPVIQCVEQGSGEFVRVDRGTDAEKAIQWFKDGVAPALRKAQRNGYFHEVCAILAGEGYSLDVQQDMHDIARENRKER